MAGHGLGEPADRRPSLQHALAQARLVEVVDEWVVALGVEVLAEEDRHPARLLVGLLAVERHPGGAGPDIDLVPQRFGDPHRAAVPPEGRVVPLRHAVMKDEEVPQPLVLVAGEAVVFRGQHAIEAAIGKEIDQTRGGVLDELDARRLERLEESGGQADGHTVAAPDLIAHAGGEPEEARLAEDAAFDALKELRLRLLVRHVCAAIDMSVADAMLQRDAPLPAGRAGTRHRVWRWIRRTLAGNRHRAVAWQPLRPVLVTDPERLCDEQAPESGGIDEKVPVDPPAVGEHHALDESVLRAQA